MDATHDINFEGPDSKQRAVLDALKSHFSGQRVPYFLVVPRPIFLAHKSEQQVKAWKWKDSERAGARHKRGKKEPKEPDEGPGKAIEQWVCCFDRLEFIGKTAARSSAEF